MSTNDVPGANPANGDTLKLGCWAEHADGSLIFVESTEANRIIYYMFDLKNHTQYRDAMPEASFKRTFTWDPSKTTSEKWTWHDKTPFPWDRVIRAGFRDGEDFPSADHLAAASERVQASRRRHRRDTVGNEIGHDDGDADEEIGRYMTGDDESPRRQSTAAERVARGLGLEAEQNHGNNWRDRVERVMRRGFTQIAEALERMPRGRR